MSNTTLWRGETTPAPSPASNAAGAAPASTRIETTLRWAAAGLAGAVGVAGAGDAVPSPSSGPTPAPRRRAHARARRRKEASHAGAPTGNLLSAAPGALRPRGLQRTARRGRLDLVLGALAGHQRHLDRHSAGVAALARTVGGRLGLEPIELEQVVQTAELHDVGKLALPEGILEKAGPLDDQEWELMRRHTVLGERIVAELPGLAEVGPLVRSSHERWDGRGYPDGLAGEEIPLASRIVFACDSFDAMTSARPYQPRPKTPAQALGELEQCAGTQFDERVVSALVEELASSRRAEREEGAMVGG